MKIRTKMIIIMSEVGVFGPGMVKESRRARLLVALCVRQVMLPRGGVLVTDGACTPAVRKRQWIIRLDFKLEKA